MPSPIQERLELRRSILDLIERRRKESGDESLGSSIEQVLIEEELNDLEKVSPHDQESVLVPVRLRGRGRGTAK